MMDRAVVVQADWDAEAGVWVAIAPNVRGLVTEADTIDALRAKLPGIIIDLLEEAGVTNFPTTIELTARARDHLTRTPY